ncbi:MAG TPA: nitroreductase family deazaflavin-dependent oxidoreductase [Mycobacterium sp.]|nr:nitroreductase family deazaflavin-dependent oxidoreductase [Mycobacterium sp.]
MSTNAFANAGARILRNRRLMRAPIWLYKARLGALLTSGLLMLEHIGRKSGARRYVVLEVVGHPTPDSYAVVAGFGSAAQWYRNVQANPHVRVYAGSRKPAPATARTMDQDEADRTMAAYRAKYPRLWEQFMPILEEVSGEAIGDTDFPLPVVELRLDPRA